MEAEIRTVEDAIDAHDTYVAVKRDATVVVGDEDAGEVAALPYNHRWTAEYRQMMERRLDRAERHLHRQWSVGGDTDLPVTWVSVVPDRLDAAGDPRPHGDVLEDLADEWERIRRELDRQIDGGRWDYLRMLVPGPGGYPELRVAVLGTWLLGDVAGHPAGTELSPVGDVVERIRGWLSGVVVESDGDLPPADRYRIFAALLWITGKRQYSASQDLTAEMKPPDRPGSRDTDGWEYIGVAHGVPAGFYEGEDAERVVENVNRRIASPPRKGKGPPRGVNLDRRAA